MADQAQHVLEEHRLQGTAVVLDVPAHALAEYGASAEQPLGDSAALLSGGLPLQRGDSLAWEPSKTIRREPSNNIVRDSKNIRQELSKQVRREPSNT